MNNFDPAFLTVHIAISVWRFLDVDFNTAPFDFINGGLRLESFNVL
jgi:hypothetical protein